MLLHCDYMKANVARFLCEFKEFVCCFSSQPFVFHKFLSGYLISFRYVTNDDVLEVNGKVACEISS